MSRSVSPGTTALKVTPPKWARAEPVDEDSVPLWKKALQASRKAKNEQQQQAAKAELPEVKFGHLPPWMRDLVVRREDRKYAYTPGRGDIVPNLIFD